MLDRWVVWRLVEGVDKDGHPAWTKVPYSADDLGRRAETNGKQTWATYKRAKECFLGNKDTLAGVGFCRDGKQYFIDCDNFFRPLRDSDRREGFGFEKLGLTFSEWAWAGKQPREIYRMMLRCDCWMELSPSGFGLHSVGESETLIKSFQANVPGQAHTGFAVYNASRYFTVTGHQLNAGSFKTDILPLLELLQEAVPKHSVNGHIAVAAAAASAESVPVSAAPAEAAPVLPALGPAPEDDSGSYEPSDEDVIRLVRLDKRGAILWNGGDPGGLEDSSHSGLDLALCQRICFYGGRDPQRIDRIFRQSMLYRDKWEEREKDYRNPTIALAIGMTSKLFVWKRQAKKAKKAAVANGHNAASVPAEPDGAVRSAWKELLLRTEKGKVMCCLANADIAFRFSPAWQDGIVLDEFANVIRTVKGRIPQTPLGDVPSWTDTSSTKAAIWLQKQGVPVTSSIVHEAVLAIAHDHRIHPLRKWLESLVWDGEPRIDRWLVNYLGAEETGYVCLAGAWWLGQAVARAFHPGTQADYCLVLEGPQGQKKSQALRVLAGDEWFTDQIADFANKDSSLDLQGKWIIELGEFDRMAHKPSVVKAFLTRQEDHFRPPYGRFAENFPRQCVFAATVNLDEYFADDTGNRRFWPVRCGVIDLAALAADRDQLWAEAVERFRDNRSQRWPSEPKQLEWFSGEQTRREDLDVWHDQIAEWIAAPKQAYDSHGHPAGEIRSAPGKVTVADILTHCLSVELKNQTQAMKQRVAKTLRRLGWKCQMAGEENARYRVYCPLKPEGE